MIKDKAGLLGLGKLKRTTVEFSGEQIEIRELSAGERDRVNNALKKASQAEEPNWFSVNGFVVTLGCDAIGEDDIDDLMDLSYELIETLADAILEISGMSTEGDEDAKKD